MYDELIKALREYADRRCPLDKSAGTCIHKEVKDAADAIEELQHEIDMDSDIIRELDNARPRWISVEERPPTETGEYLATTERGALMVGFYYAMAKNWNIRAKVKWWMERPAPPKEETE